MGLDMYLRGRRFMAEGWNNVDKETIDQLLTLSGSNEYAERPALTVEVVVGYWRKVNWVHNWFVENVQDGEDNCRPYYVAREQLEELQKACLEVLADRSKAMELLPPSEGFFFGSYEIDDYYWDSLRETVVIIGKALKMPIEEWDFQYQSSW